MNIAPLLISLVITYFIGAIPTAYIFGRLLKNLDIREHGSGNVGATNAFRVLGKVPGTLVLLIDIAKGVIPTTIVANISGLAEPWELVLIGLVAVAAHNWTVFLNFKGGKGIATSLGVLIGLTIQIPGLRWVLFIVLLSWLVVFCIFRYVSLASIVASVMLPICMVAVGAPFVLKVMSIVLCVFIVFRHSSNISRLIQGKENRVKFFKF
ncbi:MAG: glycerol-3-phosphate 1-O-acyltransferase PlsY [Candidatus Omnitrophica bacterium]|nr:glycerol-3-phosphate 1-O-acyltransferase PlsY [Candidatus Omnitrophota bacterium]